MEKYDKFFLDKCPCSKTGMLVFEQGNLSRKNLTRAIFASINYLPSALVIFSIYTTKEKFVKENLIVCTVNKFSLTRGLVKENLLV